MSLYSDHARNVTAIRRDIAQAEADKIRRKGDFWGGTLQMLGNLPLEILSQRDQRRAADQKAADEQEDRAMQRRRLDYEGQRLENDATASAAKAESEREKAARETAARILGVANPQNWGAIRKTVGTALPDFAEALPETMPPPDVIQGLQRTLVGDLGKQVDPPKAPELMEGYGPDGTTPAMVPKVPGARPFKAPTQSNPTEASLALAAQDPDPKISGPAKAALQALRNQRPATGGGSGSGALTPAQKRLAEAVIANPAIYDSLTPSAKTDIAAELSARGFKFQSKADSKPATGAQNKVLGFFNRAKQASEDLEQIEDAIAERGFAQQAWDAIMPGPAQTDIGRQYEQSQRAFTEARLRKDSGAAIPKEEFANDRKTFFVVPGDDAVTIDNKRRARYALLASIGFEAGPALGGFYGEEGESMINDFRTRAKKAAPAATQKTNPFR